MFQRFSKLKKFETRLANPAEYRLMAAHMRYATMTKDTRNADIYPFSGTLSTYRDVVHLQGRCPPLADRTLYETVEFETRQF